MKRLTLLLLGLALGVSATASAQGLTMQMSNGWAFTFGGNVNAFWVFTSRDSGPQGPKLSNSSIRTGLLPAFATFDAKGKEGGLNLGIHIGFAPQIQNGGNAHDQFGANIDMRQVYLTVGFKDGSQLLAGRELGLFDRQNILNDMTLFGVGAVGALNAQGGGTTLAASATATSIRTSTRRSPTARRRRTRCSSRSACSSRASSPPVGRALRRSR